MTDKINRIIRSKELPSVTGLQRTQTEVLIAKGQFPKPIRLGARSKGWLEAEILAWQQQRIAVRDAKGDK